MVHGNARKKCNFWSFQCITEESEELESCLLPQQQKKASRTPEVKWKPFVRNVLRAKTQKFQEGTAGFMPEKLLDCLWFKHLDTSAMCVQG